MGRKDDAEVFGSTFGQCCCQECTDFESEWKDQGFGLELEMDSNEDWRVVELNPISFANRTELTIGDVIVSVDQNKIKVVRSFSH